ncbi:MAG: PaaI family thioesterase [Paracoccaceae bacterium]
MPPALPPQGPADWPATLARIEDSFGRQTMMRTMGAALQVVAPGEVQVTAPIADHLLQQHGAAHAGMAFTLGDSAAGYAALSLMPADAEVMTVEMKINLLSPAVGDRLLAIGKVVRAGKRLSVVQAEVFAIKDDSRKAIALLQGTMIPV